MHGRTNLGHQKTMDDNRGRGEVFKKMTEDNAVGVGVPKGLSKVDMNYFTKNILNSVYIQIFIIYI